MAKRSTRNPFEKAVEQQLKKAKVKYEYEAEWLAYTLELRYLPDFVLRTDPPLYVECKGWLRPEDKQKLLAVRRQHLGIDLRILFQTNNKKQIKWAEKNKFIYAVGTIPTEWLTSKKSQSSKTSKGSTVSGVK